MKFFILACVIVVSATQKYDLKFYEKTNYFDEKVQVDQQKNTVEFDVPKHGNVQEAKYLNDYLKRLIVMRLDSAKSCYAWDMPRDEYSPTQIQAGLKQSANLVEPFRAISNMEMEASENCANCACLAEIKRNTSFKGKFPEDKYMVINENMLPSHQLNSSSLTQEINDFCGSYPVIKVAIFKDKSAMESAALAATRTKISNGRQKRNTETKTEFFLCDLSTGKYIGQCGSKGKKLKIKCKFVVAQTCVFKVACTFSSKGLTCPVPGHVFHYLHCCDYYC